MPYCDKIREYSKEVYALLTEVFDYRLSYSELGLTDQLVLQIARWEYQMQSGQVEIYKTTWPIESVWGNDIDLFIQNSSGAYDWYALQAKVMSFNGAFKDLRYPWRSGRGQWDMLLEHEQEFGSKGFYLLYCGRSQAAPTGVPTRSDCLGVPAIEELGLGIVDPQIIRNIRLNTLRHSQLFDFTQVFPDHIDSFRKLFCCDEERTRSVAQFQKEKIDIKGYRKIAYSPEEGLSKDDLGVDDAKYYEELEMDMRERARVRIIVSQNEANDRT